MFLNYGSSTFGCNNSPGKNSDFCRELELINSSIKKDDIFDEELNFLGIYKDNNKNHNTPMPSNS
jgi:hypothetical protein